MSKNVVEITSARLRRLAAAIAGFARADNKRIWLRQYIKWRVFAYRLREQNKINCAFDVRFGTDTASEVMLIDTGVAQSDATRGNIIYRPFWEADFRFALSLMIFPLHDFTFTDIGSGKGKLLLLASHYSFKHIVGLEYSPGLHSIACSNIRTYAADTQKCTSFELVLGDALAYALPLGPLICFVFNSFDVQTMASFLCSVNAQVSTRNDPVFIIYANARTTTEIGDVANVARNFQSVYTSNRLMVLCNSAGLALWSKHPEVAIVSEDR